MSDYIPFDIQKEIIKKVSNFKSLIRLRSVSKPWKSFINSSEVIACFGVRHTQPHRLLLRYKEYVLPVYVSFLDDVSFPQQQQDFAPNVPDHLKQPSYSKVIGSSCGLWCFYGFSMERMMFVIWNPSIRRSVGIVPPCNPCVSPKKLCYFGFGVCPSTYDPTIVIMSYSGPDSHSYLHAKDTDKWQVEIFTLSSKTWKMIPSSNVPSGLVILESSTQVATERFIFWVARGWIVGNDGVSQYKSLILSFDLITHEFKEVHLPDAIHDFISISKLSESLVVSAYTNEVNDGLVYGVWMMGEEGGVMTSFTKLSNIKTPLMVNSCKLLGFRKSGEPIMETVNEQWVAALEVYEPCSEHINNLRIYGIQNSFFICPYQETLLLIDHSDGCIIPNEY